jgi:hypothetical protein
MGTGIQFNLSGFGSMSESAYPVNARRRAKVPHRAPVELSRKRKGLH